jgi:putative ABC transport system permease protein
MVTLGNGATQAIKTQISSLGTNLLLVSPGQRIGGGGGGGGGVPQFTEADAEAIASQIGGVAAVAPQGRASVPPWWATAATGPPTSPAAPTSGSSPATGSSASGAPVRRRRTESRRGRLHRRRNGAARDLRRHRGQHRPGRAAAHPQFSCEVIGILAGKGQGGMGDQDDTVVVPLHTCSAASRAAARSAP